MIQPENLECVVFSFLQARTVVAENLPEDHSHQNLEKIFNVVGRLDMLSAFVNYFMLYENHDHFRNKKMRIMITAY